MNNKSYIGSANDLRVRLYVYYSVNRLNKSNMLIYKAILKYNYSSFSLDILEYCETGNVLYREQYYIDSLKPGYNILQIAGSTLGYKHTEETLEKFKLRKYSDEARANLSEAATGRVLSEETKAKISDARKGIKLSDDTKLKISATTAFNIGVAVEIANIETGKSELFPTMTDAALALGISRTTVKNTIKSGKVFRNMYIIKLKDPS